MNTEARNAAFRELATGLERVDLPVYAEYGIPPTEPTMGEGDPNCRLGLFGRDPGRHEINHRMPFVGAGGQKIRKGLYRRFHGSEQPDFEASLAIGRYAFWANTVPYKPLGNKAWSVGVKKTFQPLITDLLIHGWNGTDILCLGQVAFEWFGLGDREESRRLKAFWKRPDRFEAWTTAQLRAPDGTEKQVRLYPVPHPSPLNATWAPHFDRLFALRLQQVGWSAQTWKL